MQTDALNKIKEDEVDHLTDLLVQSMKMENSNDPEFFGICFTCGHKIRGEGSGCSAMGQMYHVKCFTCKTCHKELQGLPFYNVDGKALCEKDYMVRCLLLVAVFMQTASVCQLCCHNKQLSCITLFLLSFTAGHS